MRYIDTWLTGLGLEYIIPKLKANGITTPKKLAMLSLRDLYQVVGVENSEDRKKLFFLIQRLQTILQSKLQEGQADQNDLSDTEEIPNQHNSQTVQDDLQDHESSEEIAPNSLQHENQIIHSVSQPNLPPKKKQSHPELTESQDDQNLSKLRKSLLPSAESAVKKSPKTLRRTKSGIETPTASLDSLSVPKANLSSFKSDEQDGGHVASNLKFKNEQTEDSVTANSNKTKSNNDEETSIGHNYHIVKNKLGAGKKERSPDEHIAAKYPSNNGSSVPPAAASQEIEESTVAADMMIRVVVRKRPLSRSEINRQERDVLEIQKNGIILVHEPKTKVDLTRVIETQAFFFDDAFDAQETNEEIYQRSVKPLVSFMFEGGKASCFAYGQTGSGKTFSMMGSSPFNPAKNDPNAGLYALAGRDIFRMITKKKTDDNLDVLVSCFEIYGGKLFDLLNSRNQIKCLEDAKQQVRLPGLTQHSATSLEELLALMATAHSSRSTGATGANAESSRSHQILQITVRSTKTNVVNPANAKIRQALDRRSKAVIQSQVSQSAVTVVFEGKLSFIDLAGSERGADTTHSSKQTRMEGAEINTSLLALKEVIRSLEKKHGHTPFRGSKLTQVLKDSFVGEKSRTCMIACIAPSQSNCEHTLNTLRYADRVKEHQSANTAPNQNAVQATDRKVSDNHNAAIDEDDEEMEEPESSSDEDQQPTASYSIQQQSQLKRRESDDSVGRHNTERKNSEGLTALKKKNPASLEQSHQQHHQQQHSVNKHKKVLDSTELIQRTVGLLAAHKLSIAEMVEVMKDEMELVQEMENVDDRDTDIYLDKLERILGAKSDAVKNLRNELDSFQRFRSK